MAQFKLLIKIQNFFKFNKNIGKLKLDLNFFYLTITTKITAEKLFRDKKYQNIDF